MNRTILMLEHDDDDRYITQANLDGLKADITLSFVANSNELFQRLENNAKPDVLLITYHATPINAVEILRKLKANAATSYIPVIVISGTATHAIVRRGRSLIICHKTAF
jgi:CheY-like chemotaxis protein